MRINLHQATQAIPESDRGKAQLTDSSLTRSEGAEDQAQFSGAHIQVAALAAQASQLPEIREERISALRQVVQSGNYVADPENVAAAMMDHMISRAAA